MKPLSTPPSRLNIFLIAVIFLAFTAALSGYAATGAYMRYSGDDYCYGADLVEHGYWGTQVYAYLFQTNYAGNRFSHNLVDGIGSLAGPYANGIWPGLVLILWGGGMALALLELARVFGWKIRPFGALMVSAIVAFFVLSLTPNLSQSFYWRSALFTYLLPMAANTYPAAFVLSRLRSTSSLLIGAGLVLIFAFFSAGFSETVAALQFGVYAMVFAAGCYAVYRQAAWGRRLAWLAGAFLLGTFLSMVVLALSPANHLRQQFLPPTPGLIPLLRMSFYNTYVFMRISFSKAFWPLTLAGLAFLGLSYLTAERQAPSPLRIARWAGGVIAVVVIVYLLVVCVVAPTAYGESSYPDLRSLIAAWWVLVIGIGMLGWLAGQFLARVIGTKFTQPSAITAIRLVVILGLLAICALPVAVSAQTYAQLPRYQRWAAYWDDRDAQLRQDSRENVSTAEVMQIDHIIQDVADLSPKPTFWYNTCAARYYGVKQIMADLPGWDK